MAKSYTLKYSEDAGFTIKSEITDESSSYICLNFDFLQSPSEEHTSQLDELISNISLDDNMGIHLNFLNICLANDKQKIEKSITDQKDEESAAELPLLNAESVQIVFKKLIELVSQSTTSYCLENIDRRNSVLALPVLCELLKKPIKYLNLANSVISEEADQKQLTKSLKNSRVEQLVLGGALDNYSQDMLASLADNLPETLKTITLFDIGEGNDNDKVFGELIQEKNKSIEIDWISDNNLERRQTLSINPIDPELEETNRDKTNSTEQTSSVACNEQASPAGTKEQSLINSIDNAPTKTPHPHSFWHFITNIARFIVYPFVTAKDWVAHIVEQFNIIRTAFNYYLSSANNPVQLRRMLNTKFEDTLSSINNQNQISKEENNPYEHTTSNQKITLSDTEKKSIITTIQTNPVETVAQKKEQYVDNEAKNILLQKQKTTVAMDDDADANHENKSSDLIANNTPVITKEINTQQPGIKSSLLFGFYNAAKAVGKALLALTIGVLFSAGVMAVVTTVAPGAAVLAGIGAGIVTTPMLMYGLFSSNNHSNDELNDKSNAYGGGGLLVSQ